MSYYRVWNFLFRLACLSICLERIHSFLCDVTSTTNRRTTHLFVKEPSTLVGIHIRDSLYGEIGAVADVIMESFYADSKPPWCHMYRLAEINRLQQGFPYADRDKHRMLVAIAKEQDGSSTEQERIVGFCDCDLRIPNRPTSYKFNPRPYISDLCVSPSVRRLGIANRLVAYCEEFCQQLGQTEVFIRVERKNLPALNLYQNLGYAEIENDLDDSDKIVVLRKPLDS